jgi:hypothetical protein
MTPKPFAPNARMKKILTEAAAVGDASLRAVNYRWRVKADFYYPNSAWRPIFFGGYRFEENGRACSTRTATSSTRRS